MSKEKIKKPKSKVRKILEWIGTGIILVLIAGCSFVLIYSRVNAPKDNPNAPIKIGNTYLPMVVKTDSMDPKYPVNSAIFVNYVDPETIVSNYSTAISKGETPEIDLTFDDNYTFLEYPLTKDDVEILNQFGKNERTTASQPMRTMTHRLFYVSVHENIELGKGRYYFFVSGINESQHQAQSNQYQIFTEAQLYGQVVGCSVFVGAIFSFATSPIGLIVLLLIPCIYMIVASVLDLVNSNYKDDDSSNTDPDNPLKELSPEDKERLKKDLLAKMMEEKRKK